MRDILDDVAPWLREREPVALATVVRTWQSSPRPAGAAMAVAASGQDVVRLVEVHPVGLGLQHTVLQRGVTG